MSQGRDQEHVGALRVERIVHQTAAEPVEEDLFMLREELTEAAEHGALGATMLSTLFVFALGGLAILLFGFEAVWGVLFWASDSDAPAEFNVLVLFGVATIFTLLFVGLQNLASRARSSRRMLRWRWKARRLWTKFPLSTQTDRVRETIDVPVTVAWTVDGDGATLRWQVDEDNAKVRDRTPITRAELKGLDDPTDAQLHDLAATGTVRVDAHTRVRLDLTRHPFDPVAHLKIAPLGTPNAPGLTLELTDADGLRPADLPRLDAMARRGVRLPPGAARALLDALEPVVEAVGVAVPQALRR